MVVYLGGSITWIQPCIHKDSYFAGTPRIVYSVMCEVRLCCYRKLQSRTRSFQSSHSQRHLNILMPITHYLTSNSPVSFGILSFLNISFSYDFTLFLHHYIPSGSGICPSPVIKSMTRFFSPLFQLAFTDTQSEVLMLLNKAQRKSCMGSAHMKVP
jgi:hypothetical protein